MAAALYPSRNDRGPGAHTDAYQRPFMTDLDFRDNRYPTLSSSPSTMTQRSAAKLLSSTWETDQKEDDSSRRPDEDSAAVASSSAPDWLAVTSTSAQSPPSRTGVSDLQSGHAQSQSQSQSQPQELQKSSISYSLPPGTSRRVVERYSLDNDTATPGSESNRPTLQDAPVNGTQQAVPLESLQALPSSLLPSAPRHPSLPAAGIGAGPSNNGSPSPIMPLAAPSYNPPVSSRQRANPQQPTYIQNVTPNPVNPVYLPNNLPEEVCVECAMRDQDMADVDVTSPGVWERESDIHYEDLKRKEVEEEATGVVDTDGPPRPRASGGKLTEANLKLWLSLNPREPTSRQQTLNTYIKAQRTLLEAEALAHAQAMHEAKQLDNRMRDAYSQLRRSAYDLGNSSAPADDSGGVRIKAPLSPPNAALVGGHDRSHSRDVTLLENGMIVEHVDVRKEEREARDRRRREERRVRKSSRSSVIDATSIMSAQSLLPHTDSGVGLKPYSHYSQTTSARPMSVLTAPLDRPDIPRAQSQASFSDVHSLGSPSPRRTRFFGIRSSYWRSQDSLAMSGMSGSMVDMHVALQKEGNRGQLVRSPVEMTPTSRLSQMWPTTTVLEPSESRQSQEKEKPKKKKGLAKIWGLVTRSSKNDGTVVREAHSSDRMEDDFPLAPPPPLSYLVSRGPGDLMVRHASTPSLPSTASPKFGISATGVSPPTAPSTSLPSPASSRQSGADQDAAEPRKTSANAEDFEQQDRTSPKNVYSVISEPDLRGRATQNPSMNPPPPIPAIAVPNHLSASHSSSSRPSASTFSREKSLPPLPGEAIPRPNANGNVMDSRPRTVYTFDPRSQLPPGSRPAHDFLPPQAPFRNGDTRRQSFGGLSSRPTLDGFMSKSLNGKRVDVQDLGPNYDEFGTSRRSLRLLTSTPEPMVRQSMSIPTKRKSRFGLSSLLGRKNTAPVKDLMQENVAHQFPVMRMSGSEHQDETLTGYATSNSRHSALSAGGPRLSVTSRKALEELVLQDSEFVAYRYPSSDQRLDLAR